MKKIKHSKFKNTGFLFELLTRQITLEILNNAPEEKAKKIVQEFFGGKTELAKELRLFNLLINEKYNSEGKAEKYIDAIIETRTKLDENKLSREKYNLVKSIKENFELDSFLSSPVSNYKVLASVHKIFEAKIQDVTNVKDVFDAKLTLIEHISTSTPSLKQKEDKLMEDYRKQEKDLRLLTYKILVETFNKKYTNLNDEQKDILREYINNVTNTSKFGEYYDSKLKVVVTELHKLYSEVNDKITKIKLKETINVMKQQKIGKKVTDEQVSALMMSYELIKEIKNVKERKS
jgi:DNA repair ATPase RecN